MVWKAVDTTLDREVAIKILPEGFAADSERLARFGREARLLASLNHPNVASIYGIHEVPEAETASGAGGESTLIGEVNAAVVSASPDGGWIAYESTRAGVMNIYVRPYPATGAEVRASLQGGKQPARSP